MSHPLKEVTIRFAGDSGDGMQVTGTQFTDDRGRRRQRHRDVPRLPRRDPRARGHAVRRLRRSRCTSRRSEIFTPGDAPDVLVAMNPAALKANLEDLRPDGMLIVNADAFIASNLKKAGYDANPLDDGSLAALPGRQGADHDAEPRGASRDSGSRPTRRRPLQELLRPRPRVLDVPAPARADRRTGSTRSSPSKPDFAEANAQRAARPATHYGETAEVFATTLRGRRGAARSRACTATSPATRRSRSGLVAAARAGGHAAVPRRLSDHAGVATSCTSSSRYKNFGVAHVPGRGRDRRRRRGDRRGLRRRARRHRAPAARASRSRARRSAWRS